MAEDRRLAAILFADMVGYSALAQRDEPLALRLVAETKALVQPLVDGHGGRIVKTMGDGFLVEFASALNAAECAIALQQRLQQQGPASDSARVEMRVGIHLGDVVHDNGDVLGDAVNIAARIEPLAEASGICLSGPVYELVRNRLPYPATRLEHAFLKNIETPIAVYSVDLPWHAPPAARVTPWTDRVGEHSALRGAVDEAARGTGSAVAIIGEAGIGKTRLADEIGRYAQRRGFRVLRGRGFEDELHAPYALWVEATRSFTRDAPTALLYRVAEQCHAELVSLVPELQDRLGAPPASAAPDPEAARLRFFEGVTRFFRNLAREAPLLVVLDDLQWADPGSLALLGYLPARLRDERALLLLTFRETEADTEETLGKVLGDLRRARFLREIPLKRFDAGTSAEFVRAILATEAAPTDLVPQVADRTGGNPLFVEEILRSLVEEGSLVRTAQGWERKSAAKVEIPTTIRDVIRRRVERLGPDAGEVLASASVFGGEFDFQTLERLTGLPDDGLLSVTERLLRARLLVERETSPGRSVLRIGDEYAREVLYGQLSGPRRQRLHARAARALEAAEPRSEDQTGELARQFWLGNEPDKALEYSVRAGDRAFALYAWEAATEHYRRALEILAERPDPLLRVRVAERLAFVRLDVEGYADGLPLLEEAAVGYERLDRKREAGGLWTRIAFFCSTAFYDEARAYEALGRARRLLESLPPGPDLAWLYELTARRRLWSGAADEARDLAAKALELSIRFENVGAEMASRLVVYLAAPPEQVEAARAGLDRAVELARRSPLRASTQRYLFREVGYGALFLLGEGPGALRWFEEGIAVYEKEKVVGFVLDMRGAELAIAQLTLGHSAQAARLAEETYAYARERYPTPDQPNLMVLAELSRLRGDEAEAERYFDEAHALTVKTGADLFLTSLLGEAFRGRMYLERGETARGVEVLEIVRDMLRPARVASLAYPEAWVSSLLVAAYADSGRLEDAVETIRDVERVATTPGAPTLGAFVDLSQGVIAARRGETTEAVRRLALAADAFGRFTWPHERARALLRRARCLAEGGRAEQAEADRATAVELCRSIGATADAERALRAVGPRTG